MLDPSCLGVAGGRSKSLGSCNSSSPKQLGQESDPRLMGPHQNPMLLGLASSINSNGFGMQPHPRLLDPPFKRRQKLLGLMLQLDPLKLEQVYCYY